MYNSPTDALVAKLEQLVFFGQLVPSRNGNTHELLAQPLEIAFPYKRCYVLPHRNDNVFAKIAETLWVLSGSNDASWLSKFLPRALDFSDDGKTWRAAYGQRLRKWIGRDGEVIDQLMQVYNILHADPSSRRAVMTIFDPAIDLQPGKDIPCLSGDTILKSPESSKTLAELAEEFTSGNLQRYPVYAMDVNTKDMVLTWCNKVWKSGNKKVMKITFDDGTDIVCTLDHRFFYKIYRNKEYCKEVEAQDLEVGDRVWATDSKFSIDAKGYVKMKRNLSVNTCYSNMRKLHRAYYELVNGSLDDNMIVHHIDGDKSNNSIANLQLLSENEHNSYHRTVDNPMRKLTKEQHIARAKKQSASLKKYWKDASKDRHLHQSIIGKRRVSSKDESGQFTSNHKIVSIEYLSGTMPVYDFEVDTYHNAMVDNGVFVHNCNNWLHFIIRDGLLHMSIAQRSSDIIWGFSGINTFEFSVIQSLLASWLDVPVGPMHYFITSLHLYENHFARAKNIINDYRNVDLYDYVKPLPFTCSPNEFDVIMQQLNELDIEAEDVDTTDEHCDSCFVNHVYDTYILNSIRMMRVWYLLKDGRPMDRIVEYVNKMPVCDFRLAAKEYILRTNANTCSLQRLKLSNEEVLFFSKYQSTDSD